MTRRIMALLGLLAMTFVLAARADQPTAKKAKKADSSDVKSSNVKDKTLLEQRILMGHFQEFKAAVLRVKQRLEKGSLEDRDKAKALQNALDEIDRKHLDTEFSRLVKMLNDKTLKNVGDVEEAKLLSKKLADEINLLLTLLREDNRAAKLRDERKRLEEMIKELEGLIKDSKIVRAKTENKNQEKKDLVNSQTKINKRTKDLDNKLSGKKEGTKGNGKKADTRGENKGKGKGEGKAGEAKNKGKGEGEGKPDKKGKPSKGEGDSKGKGEGESKSKPSKGSGGEAKGDGKKGGKPSKGSKAKSKSGGNPSGSPSDQGDPPDQPDKPKKNNGDQPDTMHAQKKIQDAQQHQKKAIDELEENKRKKAGEAENKAIKDLEEAKKKLEELLRQTREEELERLLNALENRCRAMLEMQIQVLNGTVEVYKAVQGNKNKKPDRTNQQDSGRLSDKEKEIVIEATKAIEMIEAEGSAVAFAEVFKQVRTDMEAVQKDLGDTKVGVETQAIEQDIIDTLKDMIKALQKAKQQLSPPSGPSGPSGPPPDPKLLDQIAELKMIRAMQFKVNKRTKLYGDLYVPQEGEQTKKPEIKKKLEDLADRQEKLFDVTMKIVKGDNK